MSQASQVAIAAEGRRIEEAAMYSAQTQFSSAKFWRGLNLTLGIPTAVLAAAGGAAGLAEVVTARQSGLITLIAAASAAVMTALNAAQRAEQSRVAANAYLALQGAARVFVEIDLGGYDPEDARQHLQELIDRRDAINDQAPVAAFVAYLLGKRNITSGRQEYDVDVRTQP